MACLLPGEAQLGFARQCHLAAALQPEVRCRVSWVGSTLYSKYFRVSHKHNDIVYGVYRVQLHLCFKLFSSWGFVWHCYHWDNLSFA